MKKVLVTGTFDIIHPGHLSVLRQAKDKGDVLVVVVGRDDTVQKIKGYRPFFHQDERVTNLRKLGIADSVQLGNAGDKYTIIEKERPDIICLGYDQRAFTKNLGRELHKRNINARVIRLKRFSPDKHKTGLLHKHDLVAIKNEVPGIITEARYATRRNVLKKPLYRNNIILTRRNVAGMLARVQRRLEKKKLGLKIWDSYRPLSVQKQLWDFMPDEKYIGNPAIGPYHTRAAAVDLTLVDKAGKQLEMPTAFDDFSPRAHRSYPKHSTTAKKNMHLLENEMVRAGFEPMPSEWWHFTDPHWDEYPVLDISI